jgi:type IV pilus assembly protein PilO
MKKNVEGFSSKMQPLFEAVGKLSLVQRLIVGVVVFALLIAGFVVFFFKPQYEEIGRVQKQITDTDTKLKEAKKKAAELDSWKEKWAEKQKEFEVVMTALPDKQEIPALLGDISAAGRNSGLVFNRFAPQGEIVRDFYAEIPVAISISGPYERLTMFFDKIAKMDRVVNIKNISMSMKRSGGKRGKKGGGNVGPAQIDVECTAVTYRFLSESEQKAKSGKKGKKKK